MSDLTPLQQALLDEFTANWPDDLRRDDLSAVARNVLRLESLQIGYLALCAKKALQYQDEGEAVMLRVMRQQLRAVPEYVLFFVKRHPCLRNLAGAAALQADGHLAARLEALATLDKGL